jgi:glycosyltransferase involved in cell wall biosynthesis
MKRIWIDVTTTIMWWTGHPTGVQRVVYNYARRLNEDPQFDARCFILDGAVFREISFEAFERRITENSNKQQLVDDEGATVEFKRLSSAVRGHGMRALKRTVANVPVVGPIAAAGYRSARGLYRRVRRRPDTNLPANAQIFDKDDTVLLMDGNWGDGGYYAREIVRARQAIGFRMCHLIHDFIAVKNPAFANVKADSIIGGYFETVLPHVDDVVCISNSTMNDVISFAAERQLSLTAKRSVVRLGDSLGTSLLPDGQAAKMPQIDFTLPKQFLLYVSTIEIRKNHHALYFAYKLAAERGVDLPALVIVGKKGWMVEETLYMLKKDNQIKDKIIILHNADDTLRDYLYANCLFTVCPSLYEGWGLPVVESLASGKVCLAANTPAVHEAGGDLAEYFSPFDTNELLEKIARYSHNTADLRQREKKIKDTFKPHTWDDSYQTLAAFIKD